jgi:hypothetical protein
LSRNLPDRVLARNQRAVAAHLADQVAPLHRVGPHRTPVDGRRGRLQPQDGKGGNCQHQHRRRDRHHAAALFLDLAIGACDGHQHLS